MVAHSTVVVCVFVFTHMVCEHAVRAMVVTAHMVMLRFTIIDMCAHLGYHVVVVYTPLCML